MYIVIILLLFVGIVNILIPNIITKVNYEKAIMKYMKDNNYTSPHCFNKYQAKIYRNLRGIKIQLGLKNTKDFASCSEIISSYYTCSNKDLVNIQHPCSYVSSNFSIMVIQTM